MSPSIVSQCAQGFAAANLRCEEEFIRRFIASLLAKRFVILTGLAGSGKTKVAQAFARWSTPHTSVIDPFARGTQMSNSYRIMDADRLCIEFWNKDDEKVVLPRKLIEEWADFLTANPMLVDIPSKEVREKFKIQVKRLL